ncbi:MAG TPA: hypothetical protein VFW99_02255 [Candidatus Nitrosotalea sp.]|nr:hypothetical protein [Candidatus Nitrosotalea sp.]
MVAQSEDIVRMKQLASWFERHGKEIPNIDRLILKLRKDQQVGHLVNAEFVKRFHEDPIYAITDVESSDGTYDVDIQLDNRINIQTWHGQSTAGHLIEHAFEPRDKAWGGREGNISPRGGVKTDWDTDENVLFRKLNQLPNDKLGIVLLHERFIGFTFLPEWMQKIPQNKCVIKFFNEIHDSQVYGVAVSYYSDKFQFLDEIKQIISSLGYNFKGSNIP